MDRNHSPLRIFLLFSIGLCKFAFANVRSGHNSCLARLAQLVERQPFKLVVVGSSPTVGSVVFLFVLLLGRFGGVCRHVIAVCRYAGPVA